MADTFLYEEFSLLYMGAFYYLLRTEMHYESETIVGFHIYGLEEIGFNEW